MSKSRLERAVESLLSDPKELRQLVTVLRQALGRERDERQGGYHNMKGGEFTERLVVRFEKEDVARLFAAVGIVPDPIVPLGSCDDCANADEGGEPRGWDQPCSSCSHPKMVNFVPLTALMRKRPLSEDERLMMGNVQRGDWWAEGFVNRALPVDSRERNRQMRRAERVLAKAERRCLIRTLGAKRVVTNIGALSLKAARKREKSAA